MKHFLIVVVLLTIERAALSKSTFRRSLLRRSPDSSHAEQDLQQVGTDARFGDSILTNKALTANCVLEIQYDTWPQETIVTLDTYPRSIDTNRQLVFQAMKNTSRHAKLLYNINLTHSQRFQLCVNDTYGDGFEGFVSLRLNPGNGKEQESSFAELAHITGSSFHQFACTCFRMPPEDRPPEGPFECGPRDPSDVMPSELLNLHHDLADSRCNSTFDLNIQADDGIDLEATVFRKTDNQLQQTFSIPSNTLAGEWIWTTASLQCGEAYKFCIASKLTRDSSADSSTPRQDTLPPDMTTKSHTYRFVAGLTMRVNEFDFWLVKIQEENFGESSSFRRCRCFVVPWDGSPPNQAKAYDCE